MSRIYLTILVLILSTSLRAEPLSTFTVTVPITKETHTTFEIYERNNYDRVITRAQCGHEVLLAPDRYNVRIIEESKRGLREIWRYNVETPNTQNLKLKFSEPTARVQITQDSSSESSRIVFKSKRGHRKNYSIPANKYVRIPLGLYKIDVAKKNRIISAGLIRVDRELNGLLQNDLTLKWISN